MSVSADKQMQALNKKFRSTGMMAGLISGLLYGIYSTLAIMAGAAEPLAGASAAATTLVQVVAIAFVTSGLNDIFAGLWLLMYNIKQGKVPEMSRTLKTTPGKIGIIGALVGGPIANGAYLIGLSWAGAYAIPISATNALFGSLFAALVLKQRPNKRVVSGMVICVLGAIIVNWVKPEGADNFVAGILFALVAAVCWGLEGAISSYGGSMLDTDVTVNIRELVSGVVTLILAVVFFQGLPLLTDTVVQIQPMVILAFSGLSAGVSFLFWYKANSKVGCAIGMSLNISYAFWGVLFCIIFLGTPVTPTIIIGSMVIILGAILVTMNPLDFFKKEA